MGIHQNINRYGNILLDSAPASRSSRVCKSGHIYGFDRSFWMVDDAVSRDSERTNKAGRRRWKSPCLTIRANTHTSCAGRSRARAVALCVRQVSMIRLFTAIFLLVAAGCTYAIQPDPVYRETEVRNQRPRAAGEKFDPKEANPELRQIFMSADKTAERRVGNVERDARFIHIFWQEKKSVLRDKYGIQWQSPADLNPDITYGNYGQPVLTEEEKEAATDHLRSKGFIGDESIRHAWRMFDGTVYVATIDNKSAQARHYRLSGAGDEWRFIDVHFVEE